MSKGCALPRAAFPVKFKVKSPVHALELARELIRPYRHWTTGNFAVQQVKGRAAREEVPVKDPKAEAFCALGALLRVNSKHQDTAQDFLELAAAEVIGWSKDEIADYGMDEGVIFDANDGNGDRKNHRQVVKMFTRAIQLAKRASKKGKGKK